MTWTESQRNAIEAKNKTLLVSAGAGSGKTTVLTRRLTERILTGDSVEDFLVVTFTRAAAGDLKEKLYNSLTVAITDMPQNRHLFNQLFLLSGAKISTIHSFCFDIIKKNFSVLGLSPKMRIADDTEVKIIARTCMEELVDTLYEQDDEYFILLVDNFGGEKSDDELIEKLLSLYDRLRAFHNYNEWLEEQNIQLYAQAELVKTGFFNTVIGDKIKEKVFFWLEETKAATEELMLFLSHNAESEANILPVEVLYNHIELLINSAEISYKSLYTEFLNAGRLPPLKTKGMSEEDADYLKNEKSRITKELTRIKKAFCSHSEQQISEDYQNTARIGTALNNVLKQFDSLYSEAKKKRAILDYADLEHFLAKLLEEKDENEVYYPSELCERLKKNIKEIYIDEYQDVNPLQDHIFTLLSRSNNRFMVGDIKQSIYRFRNAYPDIFVNYKESFPDFNNNESAYARIFLKENFRCGKPIIDFVNSIFAEVTSGNRFNKEYEGEELVYAKKSESVIYPVMVALSTYDETYKDKEIKQNVKEKEADFIAVEIKRLVGHQKKEDGSYIKYSDIALLFSAVRGRSHIFEQSLRRKGIPCMTEQDESLFSLPEIMLTISALKTVDNPTDDISLCALMRSPIYNFTVNELYIIRSKNFGLSTYDSVVAASCLGTLKRTRLKIGEYLIKDKRASEPKFIIKKCCNFLSELNFYRTKAQGMLCYKFLWLFYMRSGLLSSASSFENGEKCRENLLLLYQYTRNFEKTGFKGLSSFILYISEIAERSGDLSNAKSCEPEGDFVRIMSIHKSKGLEFPVCFVVDAARQFGSRDAGGDLMLSRELGISCRLKDAEKLTKKDTYLRRISAVADIDASMNEELRKLYVALTRAKERLYITACVPADYNEKRYNPLAAKSFSDWILQTVTNCEKDFYNVYIIPDDINNMYVKTGLITDKNDFSQDKTDSLLLEKVKSNIDFIYPHSDLFGIPAKLSVSELSLNGDKKSHINQKMILCRPQFLGKSADSGAKKGTANHIFMQFADFGFIDKYGVTEEAKRLLNTKMITEEQFDLLSYRHLEAFFTSDLYKEFTSAIYLYREKRFSLSESAEIVGGPKGENILIQGVIDCFFENVDGSYTLVDYKTDFLPTEGGEQILVERHEKQLKYYCKAVSAMTGKKVARAVLYSFSLDKSIEVKINDKI